MTDTIHTASGQLRGTNADIAVAEANQIKVFRGIPYAQPPVGALRWKAPVAPTPWTGIRDATEFSRSCIQPTNIDIFVWTRGYFDTSEDCLYLNVWSNTAASKQPVMVWFHGGAHTSGQGHSDLRWYEAR